MKDSVITMDHGSGGVKTSELIGEIFQPAFSNEMLDTLGDGALLNMHAGTLAFSTDSYVVQPIRFPGGDIGKMAVCGTINDLAMCGARPKWLSLGMILEEGLPISELKSIVQSIADEAKKAGVAVVTGDTKVVEHGHGDGIYINTAGIGVVEYPNLSPDSIRPGDVVIVSGPIGNHGASVMLARHNLGLMGNIESDCMPLYDLARAAWETGEVHCLRDATRGGVATTLNEFTVGRSFGIRLFADQIPVRPEVRAVSDMLGLDPLYCANEGRFLCIASPKDADNIIEKLKKTAGGESAAVIGEVTERFPGQVVLKTELGAHRVLSKLTGAQLPRIC